MKTLRPLLALCLVFSCQSSKPDAPKTTDKTQLARAAAQEKAPKAMDCAGEDKSSCGGSEEPGGCAQWDEAAAEVAKRKIPADAQWETLKVDGMTCGGCERRVVANVGEVEGILAVEADAELGQVRVAIQKDNQELKVAAIEKIKSLGYTIQ